MLDREWVHTQDDAWIVPVCKVPEAVNPLLARYGATSVSSRAMFVLLGTQLIAAVISVRENKKVKNGPGAGYAADVAGRATPVVPAATIASGLGVPPGPVRAVATTKRLAAQALTRLMKPPTYSLTLVSERGREQGRGSRPLRTFDPVRQRPASAWLCPSDVRGEVMRRVRVVATGVAALLLLGACAAGVNTAASGTADAGFWLGLWHGAISPITFIVSLFKDSVSIYEVHNTGNWYDFGFMLGVSIAFSGAGRSSAYTSSARRGAAR
jgi:hypothetical protein